MEVLKECGWTISFHCGVCRRTGSDTNWVWSLETCRAVGRQVVTYKLTISVTDATCLSSFMDRILGGATALIQASHLFACRAHCSPSILGPFILGIICGLCISVPLCICACFFLWQFISSPALGPRQAAAVRTLSRRLGGYLHEH